MLRKSVALLIICCFILLIGCSSSGDNTNYRLLIYYGTPKGINDVWNNDKAARIFSNYDYIVFGDVLSDPKNIYHSSTIDIIAKIRKLHKKANLFGYINIEMLENKYSLDVLKQKVDMWKSMGVDGIFVGCAGYDYNVTRERQNAVIQMIHESGLTVFVNAWEPDDVMGNEFHPVYNPNQIATAMQKGDLYLIEKFLLPYDVLDLESPSLFSKKFRTKMEKALQYRKTLGVKLLSVSRINYNQVSKESLLKFFHMNEAAAGVFSLDGYGVAPVEYSSSLADSDLVVEFPYMRNYMEYYVTDDVVYEWIEESNRYERNGFTVESIAGYHDYKKPEK